MEKSIVIGSLPQAFEVIKQMELSEDEALDYRHYGREALKGLIEGQGGEVFGWVGASGRGSKELGDIELCVPRARTYSAVEVICRYARRVGNTVAKQLDTAVEASHRRPIRGRYRVLVLDGVVLRRRTGVGSVKRVVLVALGMRWDGRKEVIDFFTAKGESQGAWEGFDGRRS